VLVELEKQEGLNVGEAGSEGEALETLSNHKTKVAPLYLQGVGQALPFQRLGAEDEDHEEGADPPSIAVLGRRSRRGIIFTVVGTPNGSIPAMKETAMKDHIIGMDTVKEGVHQSV
jgi:hypothetical protein